MNMIIAGDGFTNIRHGNSLTEGIDFLKIGTDRKEPLVDFILANPPFGMNESELDTKLLELYPLQTSRGQALFIQNNDLADGRHPQEVCLSFEGLVERVSNEYGSIPCYFISLKPSVARWGLTEQFKYTNQIIAEELNRHPNWRWVDIFTPMLNSEGVPNPEYFVADGLHLNKKGYQLWAATLQKALDL